MSLTVTRARVKEKCGVGDTSYDTPIDNLIAEIVPVIETSIDSAALANTSLASTLNLGATEIVCGEFLCQLAREPGATEGFDFNGLTVYGRKVADDAATLKAQGAARLEPYLRSSSTILIVDGKEAA